MSKLDRILYPVNSLLVIFYSVLILTGFWQRTPPKPDYEAQANCIAEYDYHHYNSNMMRNLVVALEKCR